MRLFSKSDKANPANLRVRNPQRQSTTVGQNRTFSYHAARSQTELNVGREAVQDKPPLRRLPTRLQRLRKHGGWFAVTILALGLVVYQLQLSTTPKVVSLVPASEAVFLQDTIIYQKAAQELFNDSAANRNKLTVNSSDIALHLQEQFPELQDVSVSLPFLGATPTVFVRPAMPALVLAASNGTYVVDENGRALAEASARTNLSRLKVPTVTDQSSLSVELGSQVLPRSATDFVQLVTEQLKQQKLTVQSMTLPAAAGELNVYITGKPYFIKFNLQQGSRDTAAVQMGTFVAVIKQLEKTGNTPSQYVDVRLEGRAYYQ